jgi:hypothetical protein
MPLALGLFLGFANVIVNAISIDLALDSSYATYDNVISIGLVPGLVMGMALGGVAALTRALDPWLRCVFLVTPALAVVYWLACGFGLEGLAPHASIPTLVCCSILERRTRETDGADESSIPGSALLRAHPVLLGAIVGLIDVVVIGTIAHVLNIEVVLIGFKGEPAPLAPIVFVFGCVPAIAIGALLGKLARETRMHSIGERRFVLCSLPVFALIVIASLCGIGKPVLLALLPTVCCGLWLESATRSPSREVFVRARAMPAPPHAR